MVNMNSDFSLAIQTFGITRKFGASTVVDRIDLNIRKGEIFSLLGPNGAGKTTMIRMLSCLLSPTSGTASIMGKDIMKEPQSVKQVINVSPQETAIAGHLNIMENMMLIGGCFGLSRSENKSRAEELIRLAGLQDRMKDQARKLSGGMQRRLSIAMALISDPQVLFLDEPTLGLDPQSRRELWKQIENLKGKKTILLTTHYLEEADALSDRIAIIKNGKLIVEGTSEELKRGLHGLQTMTIRSAQVTPSCIEGLKSKYQEANLIEGGLEIKSPSIVFDETVDYIRSEGTKIDWLTMNEVSLDDVFLTLTEEEVKK
jgi:ABC-2 type transport system ATP-binding protein